jgi:hypothetical protein
VKSVQRKARPVVDHRPHDRRAETGAARRGLHVDVGEVGEVDAVGHRTGEPDGRTVVVGRHQPPRVVELRLHVGLAAAAPPVGLGREEPPDRVAVDPRGIVVDLEPADPDDHRASIALSTYVDMSRAVNVG